MNAVRLLTLAILVMVLTVESGVSNAHPVPVDQVAAACEECHGPGGISSDPVIPNLAGQDRLYLEKQLMEFRHKPARELEFYQLDTRDSHVMDGQSHRFDADDLFNISKYYSDMRCDANKRRTVEAKPDGCGQCHGDDGLSSKPGIPNLAGQKEAYLLAQLKAFKAATLERSKVLKDPSSAPESKTGRRHHHVMGQWAARLSEPEMVIAARYYSSLPGIWVCN